MTKKLRKSSNLPKKFSKPNENSQKEKISHNMKIFLFSIPVIVIVVIALVLFNINSTTENPTTPNQSTKEQPNAQITSTPITSAATTPAKTATSMATITPVATKIAEKEITTDSAFKYQMQEPQKGDTVATMKTSMGEIKIKFFPKEAPKAVENFTKLAQNGYYNGLTFHRVINEFMIQGGDPTGTSGGGESIWNSPFPDEFSTKLHNFRGALSMANSGPNTNGSQFFIVQKKPSGTSESTSGSTTDINSQYIKTGGTPWLDGKHTVFGQVFKGLDIVDSVAEVKVDTNYKPLTDVKIDSVDIVKY